MLNRLKTWHTKKDSKKKLFFSHHEPICEPYILFIQSSEKKTIFDFEAKTLQNLSYHDTMCYFWNTKIDIFFQFSF